MNIIKYQKNTGNFTEKEVKWRKIIGLNSTGDIKYTKNCCKHRESDCQ